MPPKAPNPNRPQIWAEGRQTPRFDVRAFAKASLQFGRSDMAGLLQRCAASADGASAQVATGRWRVPEARLGRAGRYLPSHLSVAGAVSGASGLLKRASRTLEKRVADTAPATSLFTTLPKPDAPLAPRPYPAQAQPQSDDPDLAAIRALMSAPVPGAAAFPPQPAVPLGASAPAPRGWLREPLAGMAGTALAYGLLAMSLPYGAVKAGLAHLNGEDLRKLDA
jgi:hypothetical protein